MRVFRTSAATYPRPAGRLGLAGAVGAVRIPVMSDPMSPLSPHAPQDPGLTTRLLLPEAEDTARLGVWLAPRLAAGDVVLLEGPIGAGKSHLARALIRARLGYDEDIPSPTFTLVQVYETMAPDGTAGPEIWHADLYRLGHPDEVLELGLDAAFQTGICLIEWPDRLGALVPADAISLRLSSRPVAEGEGRWASVTAPAALTADLRRDWAGFLAE